MEAALKREIEASHKEQIVKRLADTHHFDLPDSLVEREVNAMVRKQLESRARQRVRGAEAGEAVREDEAARLRDEVLPEAKRRVKVGLILESIAEKEGVHVEEQDVAAELERLARRLNVSADDVGRMIQAGGQEMRDEILGRLLADKSLDFVYRHAVIQG